MKLRKANADIFVPDGLDAAAALPRTTHLGVGAHQDDLEAFALHGILACFGQRDQWFTGVTCTDGRGSSRAGVYAAYTDEDMMRVRQDEQRAAAQIGRYAAVLQLMYSSVEARSNTQAALVDDLFDILQATRPAVIYTHNPADKHPTHIGVFAALLAAVRRLPREARPQQFYGCEVWRDLDWMPDARKVVLDVSGRDSLASALMGVFDSQIAGGKRYDLAFAGRRVAHATMLDSHAVDKSNATIFAMDLLPLVQNDALDVVQFVTGLIDEFRTSVVKQLETTRRQ